MIFSLLLLALCYLALIVVIVGCANGRIGINAVVGLRTAALMRNERSWRTGHQAAKLPTLFGVVAAIALLVPAALADAETAQGLWIMASCVAMLLGGIVGAVAGSRAARRLPD